MKTNIFPCSNIENFNSITEIIGQGGIIVYPTETVYGIGCDMNNERSVQNIYNLKNRPNNLPLSLNLYSIDQIGEYVREIPNIFYDLARQFLPGPLAVIFNKNDIVPDFVTSGMKTVGIRIPDNACFLEILKALNRPLAGTSANISGNRAAIDFENSKIMFDGNVDIIVDNGRTKYGEESTIIDLSGKPKILRHGIIKKTEIEKFF